MSTVAYWRLNGDGLDYSGNGYTVTGTASDVNLTYGTGKYGQCTSGMTGVSTCFWNGTNGLVANTFTMMAWVNMKVEGALFGIVNNNTKRSYYFKVYNSNQFVSGAFDKTGTTTSYTGHWHEIGHAYAEGTSSLLNKWYHVAYSVTNASSTCYVNGSKLPTVADLTAPNGTVTFTCAGVSLHGTRDYGDWIGSILYGRMDEVILDNTAWTAAQLKNYYNQAMGRYAPKIRF
jgi:hypothetical protein